MHRAAARMEIHGVDWTVSLNFQVWLVCSVYLGRPSLSSTRSCFASPCPSFFLHLASCVCPMGGINQ